MKLAKTLRLGKKDLYQVHLRLINSILPIKLTEKEIEVLSSFMFYGAEDMFDLATKKKVMEDLSLSNGGLCNYLTKLKEKGFIVSKGKKSSIVPALLINLNEEKEELEYHFKLIVKDE